MGNKKKWFSVKLVTTVVVKQYHVVLADNEEQATQQALAMAPDDTWIYDEADYDDIDAEVIEQK